MFRGPFLSQWPFFRRQRMCSFMPFCQASSGANYTRIRSDVVSKMYKRKSSLHLTQILGRTTEILQLHSDSPALHIIFIPGNPGVIAFYQDYLEELFTLFNGAASITGLSHIAHTAKKWEDGGFFSLDEQVQHKVNYLKETVGENDIPLILVGHSIGAYMAVEILKALPKKVCHVIGLFPFLTVNHHSQKQWFLSKIVRSSFLRMVISHAAGLIGKSPMWLPKSLIKALYGKSWGSSALDIACIYLLQKSVVENVMFMAMTEFKQLREEPDWGFIHANQRSISLLFGGDDHWGPLAHFEKVLEQAPEMDSTVEDTCGILHDFCCSNFGSSWVAQYTRDVIGRIRSVDMKDATQ